MRFSIQASQLSVVPCFAFAYLACVAICIDRGDQDRYWSGRPQPIGIDLSYKVAVAVYANGKDNFTTLGYAVAAAPSRYEVYMYTSYNDGVDDYGHSSIRNDDDQLPLESWIDTSISTISSWARKISDALQLEANEEFIPTLQWAYYMKHKHKTPRVPKKPISKYRKTFSQAQRTAKLRSMMPKWFRTSPTEQLTKSGLIVSVAELLLDLKRTVWTDHNIDITSATVSRPSWISHWENDMIDEACLLAGIELLEPPKVRSEIAATGLSLGGSVIVIDNGPWHMNIMRLEREPYQGRYVQRALMTMKSYASDRLTLPLTNYFRDRLNNRLGIGGNQTVGLLYKAVTRIRSAIKFYGKWPAEMEFADRTVVINFGFPEALNITGQDILNIEDIYVDDLSAVLKRFTYNDESINSYARQTPGMKDPWITPYGECGKIYDEQIFEIAHHVTPPPELNLQPFIWPVKHVIILDTGHQVPFLVAAAEKAFNLSTTDEDSNTATCTPSYAIAARGAAMYAVKWTRSYDLGYEVDWNYDERNEEWVLSEIASPEKGASQDQEPHGSQDEL